MVMILAVHHSSWQSSHVTLPAGGATDDQKTRVAKGIQPYMGLWNVKYAQAPLWYIGKDSYPVPLE